MRLGKGIFLRKICIVALLAALSACSFETKDSKPFKIELIPPLKSSTFQILKKIGVMSAIEPDSSLSDFQCFGINVTGGSIESETKCTDIEAGATDGTSTDLHKIFEPLLPVGEELNFQAFGTTNGCNDPTSPGDTVFFSIGETTATVSGGATIRIPVSYSTVQNASCSHTPYTIFNEDFSSYSPVNWDAANTGSVWLGNTDATVASADYVLTSNMGTCSGASFCGVTLNRPLKETTPFTRVTIDFSSMNLSNAAHSFRVQFAGTVSPTPSSGVECGITFPGSVLTLSTSDASGFPSTSTNMGSAVTPIVKLICERHYNSNGTVRIVATAIDNVSAVFTHDSTDISTGPVQGENLIIRSDFSGGGGSSSIMTNVKIEKSNFTQP